MKTKQPYSPSSIFPIRSALVMTESIHRYICVQVYYIYMLASILSVNVNGPTGISPVAILAQASLEEINFPARPRPCLDLGVDAWHLRLRQNRDV